MTQHNREIAARLILEEVCRAAALQLAGMGKGKEPSPRLAAAFAAATRLLGKDPTLPEIDPRDAELAQLRAAVSLKDTHNDPAE